MVRCSPALMPTSCSSKPGMNDCEPITTGDIVARAALERHAVDGAGERDRHLVAELCVRALAFRQERPVLIRDAADRFVDLRLGHLGGEAIELDVLEVAELDLRQHFHRDRVVEIGLALDHRLDGVFLGRQLDLRLHREAQIVVRDDLRVRVAHRRLDRLGHHRAAIHALQVPDRHLAGTEAVDANRALELVKARVDLGVEVVCRDHHAILALQSIGECFGNLHGQIVLVCSLRVVLPRV